MGRSLLFSIVAVLGLTTELRAEFPESFAEQIDRIGAINEMRQAQKSFVVLMPLAPLDPLDFRTGDYLKASVLHQMGGVGKQDVGHILFGWSCVKQGQRREELTGHTGESSQQVIQLMENGWGLTPLLATFTDGMIQNRRVVDRVLRNFVFTDEDPMETAVVVMEVPHATCDQGVTFIERFRSGPNAAARRFGSLLDPLKFEGGGCVTVAHAFLKTMGLLPEVLPDWWRRLAVPTRLLGRGEMNNRRQPLNMSKNGEVIANAILPFQFLSERSPTIYPIQLTNMIWNAMPGEEAVHFSQIDPEAITFSVRQMARRVSEAQTPNLSARARRRQMPSVWRERSFQVLRMNFNPPQYEHIRLDEGFDQGYGDNFARIFAQVPTALQSFDLARSTVHPMGKNGYVLVLRAR